jgi:hypothetical protein
MVIWVGSGTEAELGRFVWTPSPGPTHSLVGLTKASQQVDTTWTQLGRAHRGPTRALGLKDGLAAL